MYDLKLSRRVELIKSSRAISRRFRDHLCPHHQDPVTIHPPPPQLARAQFQSRAMGWYTAAMVWILCHIRSYDGDRGGSLNVGRL
jgi:hypothetical protein